MPVDVVEDVYRTAEQPVLHLADFISELRYWYQAFPHCNYLQPCVISGRAALVCQNRLSEVAALAFQTLSAICDQFDIYLKEDSRGQINENCFVRERRRAAVTLAFCLSLALSDGLAAAESQPIALVPTAAPAISMVVRNQTLSEITNRISSQSGIRFKFGPEMENDRISNRVAAADWQEALAQLLQGYNYSTIQEQAQIRTVLISGYQGGVKKTVNDSGAAYPDLVSDIDDSLAMLVDIPIEELKNLSPGELAVVNLPVGKFNVNQKSMVSMENGAISWVGIMNPKNQYYRLYLAQTQTGDVIGSVTSPDGSYNIKTIDGQTVMIEADTVSMQ